MVRSGRVPGKARILGMWGCALFDVSRKHPQRYFMCPEHDCNGGTSENSWGGEKCTELVTEALLSEPRCIELLSRDCKPLEVFITKVLWEVIEYDF